MAARGHGWTDQQVEQVVGNLLRAGVLLAAAVTLVGGIWYLIQHGAEPRHDYSQFQPERGIMGGLGGVIRRALTLQDSRALIQFGILLLIATPIARVVLAVFAFAWQRDRVYVGVTLVVLAVLLYSFVGGFFL